MVNYVETFKRQTEVGLSLFNGLVNFQKVIKGKKLSKMWTSGARFLYKKERKRDNETIKRFYTVCYFSLYLCIKRDYIHISSKEWIFHSELQSALGYLTLHWLKLQCPYIVVSTWLYEGLNRNKTYMYVTIEASCYVFDITFW